MNTDAKPLIISAPYPRTLDLIFDSTARKALHAGYEVQEVELGDLADLEDTVLNVESNLFDNMPY